MGQSAFTNATNPALQGLKIVAGGDLYIYIGATGSDTKDGLTPATAVATLRQAWNISKNYTIYGDNVLYIQFQKGIYNYNYDTDNPTQSNPFPDNLYHPQGANIIIQGDITQIDQRYIYKVKDYSWDLSRWGFFGHTGTVNGWYYSHLNAATGPVATGLTTHGFSAEDVGGYVAITNAYMGAGPNGYNDNINGVRSTKYTVGGYAEPHNHGRYSFNHGLSYEDAYAIVGLARIEGASANPYDLKLQFKYQNLDGRIHTYPGNLANGKLVGGLANTVDYAGIASNYPEPQYSEPNGYYGPTYGVLSTGATIAPNTTNRARNESVSDMGWTGGSVFYPARGAEKHVTDDAHLLTSYPVVIRVTPTGSLKTTDASHPVPINISGGTIRTIRNLMFVNTVCEGASYGQYSPTNGLDTITDVSNISWTSAGYQTAPSSSLINLENGSVLSIRHIGSMGYGRSAYLVTVKDSSLTTDNGGAVKGNNYARLGSITNTPVLMSTHGGGIYADGLSSIVDLSNQQSLQNIMLGEASTWIQRTSGHGIIASGGAKVTLGGTHIVSAGNLPGIQKYRLEIPIFSGTTLTSGSTGGFYIPEFFTAGRGGTAARYKSVIGYKNVSGTRTAMWRILGIGNVPSAAGSTYATTGWTSAAWSGATTGKPLYTQGVIFHGYRLNSNATDGATAMRNFLTTAGSTLEFFAYSDDVEGVTIPGEYLGIGAGGIVMGLSGGNTLTGVLAGTIGITTQYQAATSWQLYNYSGSYGMSIDGRNSVVCSRGNLLMSGKSICQIINRGGAQLDAKLGTVHVRDFSHSGMMTDSNGNSFVGGIIAKHPIGYGWGGYGEDTALASYNFGIYSRYGGDTSVGYNTIYGACISIGVPFSSYGHASEGPLYKGLWSRGDANVAGSITVGVNTPILTTAGSSLRSPTASYSQQIAGWDGGTAAVATLAGATPFQLAQNSYGSGGGSATLIWNTSQGQAANTGVKIMTRGAYGTAIASGQQLMYNAPMGTTLWFRGNFDNSVSAMPTGLMAGTVTPSATSNSLYKDPVVFVGTGVLTQATTQRAAAYTANPPGFSAAGYAIDATSKLTDYYEVG